MSGRRKLRRLRKRAPAGGLRPAAEKQDFTATDEAGFLELLGCPVRVVEDPKRISKLPDRRSLPGRAIIMESGKDGGSMAGSCQCRSGFGYDAHRLVRDDPLYWEGKKIPHEKGLQGHSDADVLTHALCDAMLGAAGAGDIGGHYPDTDMRI